MTDQQILTYLSQGRLDKAIESLQGWLEHSKDARRAESIASRWADIQRRRESGELSETDFQAAHNELVQAVRDLVGAAAGEED